MSSRFRFPSKSTTFLILMVLAGLTALLPDTWTNWIRGPFQILGLPQWTLLTAAQNAEQSLATAQSTDFAPEDYYRLKDENDELRDLLAKQEGWLIDLERRYEQITNIREQVLPEMADILIAPVLGYDSSPRRDTLLIGRGAKDRVRAGQWVAAGVSPEETEPGQRGAQLLLRQWLVGRVGEVRTHVSRVQLASDPKFGSLQTGQEVLAAKVLEDGTWQTTAGKYILLGCGGGRMVISQADTDLLSEGYELVVVPPSRELPVMLNIGRITSSKVLESSSLHFDLEVRPWADVHDLRYVYVILVGE